MAECSSCGQRIVWVKTEAGKQMPVDPEPVSGGNLLLEALDGIDREWTAVVVQAIPGVPMYRSHFASCPQAAEHRKRKLTLPAF